MVIRMSTSYREPAAARTRNGEPDEALQLTFPMANAPRLLLACALVALTLSAVLGSGSSAQLSALADARAAAAAVARPHSMVVSGRGGGASALPVLHDRQRARRDRPRILREGRCRDADDQRQVGVEERHLDP